MGLKDLLVRSDGLRVPAPATLRAQLGRLRRYQRHIVDRWYPSSKTCFACGTVNKALQLHQRRWTCQACGTEHDRDENAALNIEREGLRLLASTSNTRTVMSGVPCSPGRCLPTGIDARGELGAVAGVQKTARPQHRRSLNRELVARRCAPNRPDRRSGTGDQGGA